MFKYIFLRIIGRISGSTQIRWPVWLGFQYQWGQGLKWLSGSSISWQPPGSDMDSEDRCGYALQNGSWVTETQTYSEAASHSYVCEMTEQCKTYLSLEHL